MRLSNRLLFGSLLLLTAAVFIVIRSSATGKKKVSAPTCCKKSRNACTESGQPSRPGELIIDNLSRQFIMVNPITY